MEALVRDRFQRLGSVAYHLGSLLQIVSVVVLFPIPVVILYWGNYGEGFGMVLAFAAPALAAFMLGTILRTLFVGSRLDPVGAMLICACGWLAASVIGAIPFVIGINASFLDGYFEAMSGFTAAGITVLQGLDSMPRSILFWRALTQWIGGLGIISFFLTIVFRGVGTHQLLGAESHKISAARPAPGLFNTLKILWGIYLLFTLGTFLLLWIQGMSLFDALCHSFTTLATGGFSPYDASIAHYEQIGHPNFRLIEYTLIFAMLLGGMNFLVHYRVLTRDFRALWDNIEIRWWWGLIVVLVGLVFADSLAAAGGLKSLFFNPSALNFADLENAFRHSLFQVVAILTTTGFRTRDIGLFPTVSRQLFLVMMVIGGCVGSTSGGFKVMRVAVLFRLVWREVYKLCVSRKAVSPVVAGGEIVSSEEILRIGALFFAWMGLLVVGGVMTAIFAPSLSPWAAFSGMFSALGTIGPSYISVAEMSVIHPVIKCTYILGMLAGRLEILPVLLLFSPKAWR